MQQITVDITPSNNKKTPIFNASQYDVGREFRANLVDNLIPYTLDGTELLTVSVRKGDNTLFTADIANTFGGKSYVDFVSTEQMCAVAGYNFGELTIEKNNTRIGTINFMLVCEPSPEASGLTSESEINNLNRQIDDYLDETLPEQVEEVAPAIVEEVAPAVVREVAPAVIEDVAQPILERLAPSAVEEAAPSIVERLVPAEVEEVAPAIVREVAPPIVEELVPIAVGDNYYNKTQTDGKIEPLNNALGENVSLVGNPLVFTDDGVHNATASVEGATQIAVYGKQMFNANAWSSIASVANGIITFDGTVATSSANNFITVPFLPKGKYTIKIEAMDETAKYCRFAFRAKNNSAIADTNAYLALPYTVIMNPTQDVYKMSAVVKHENSDGYSVGSIRITINRGESVGDYEAYKGGVYSVGDTIQTLNGQNFIAADTASDITLTYQKLIKVSALEARITQNENDIAEINSKDIVKFNEDVLSDVNACSSYGLTALGTNLPLHTLSMLFATDIHSFDFEEVKNAVKYLNAIDSVDIGICLGDMAPSKYTDSATSFIEAVQGSNKPFYTIYGNHDIGNNKSLTDSTTVANAFNKWVKDTTSIEGLSLPYYKIDTEYGLTLIFLNNYDVPDTIVDGAYKVSRGAEVVSQTQVDWLLNVLDNVPADNTVVIFRHSFPDSSIRTDCNFSMYASGLQGNGTACYTDLIPDIVNAWKNGLLLNKTYLPNISDVTESITINHDFTSRGMGKFACYVVGHSHRDIVAKSNTYNDQIVIGFEATSYTNYINNGGDLPRVANEKSHDAITVLSVDTSTKLIKMVRVGSNKTVRMVDRTSIAIAYT